MGAYGASASNAGGLVANISAGPGDLGGALLRRHKGFKLFVDKTVLCARVLRHRTLPAAQAQGF